MRNSWRWSWTIGVVILAFALGCSSLPPQQDGDGDGVSDAIDRCPGEKGPISNLGCPVEAPPAPTCPATCPLGSTCYDPKWGCEPTKIPWEGVPDCVKTGKTEECAHWPQGSDEWLYICAIRDSNGVIVARVNVAGGPAQCPANPPPGPKTCADLPCPTGQLCSETPDGPKCYTPTPPPGEDPPPIPDYEMIGTTGGPQTRWDVLWPAVQQWMAANPTKVRYTCTNGGPGLSFSLKDTTVACPWCKAIETTYADIARILWAQHVWSGQPITRDGGRVDKYAVQQAGDPQLFEYFNLLEYGGACFGTAQSLDGIYIRQTTAPPPQSDCDGIPRVVKFRFGSHPEPCSCPGQQCDVDPMAPGVEGTDWSGNVIRGWCEAQGRPGLYCTYGANAGSPGRVADEKCGIGGDGKIVWHSNGQLTIPDDNPIHAKASCEGCTWMEACAHDGTTGCSRVTFQ